MTDRTIYITEQDKSRLRQLIANARYAEYRGSKYFEALVGERRIRVEAILYQPEAAGDYDL